MTPLKNDVVLYSHEYQCYFRAYCYQLVGYGWLFRVNNKRFFEGDEDFKLYHIDQWFDEHSQHGFSTMLVRSTDCLYSDGIAELIERYGS